MLCAKIFCKDKNIEFIEIPYLAAPISYEDLTSSITDVQKSSLAKHLESFLKNYESH